MTLRPVMQLDKMMHSKQGEMYDTITHHRVLEVNTKLFFFGGNMKIISWNVNGIRAAEKRAFANG